MRVVYQGVQLGDTNAARFTWGRRWQYGQDDRLTGWEHEATFGEIAFAVAGQADCFTKMAAIEVALSLPGGNLLVQNDDNSDSVNAVYSAATFGGVRPVFLTWDDRPGAQFHTWRSYSCGFRWRTMAAGVTTATLSEFSESVTVEGGTPRQVVQEPINELTSSADEFITIPKQKYVVTQRGRAVGVLANPNLAVIAPPLYPNPRTNPVTRTSPQRVGGLFTGYAVEWLYQWEFGDLAALPLPNLWP